MKRNLYLSLMFFVFCIQCSAPAGFKEPTNISTKVSAARKMKPIKTVTYEQCSYYIFPIPIMKNPLDLYEGVLEEARKVGGNGVMDYQVRGSKTLFALLYGKFCFEGVGTAVSW